MPEAALATLPDAPSQPEVDNSAPPAAEAPAEPTFADELTERLRKSLAAALANRGIDQATAHAASQYIQNAQNEATAAATPLVTPATTPLITNGVSDFNVALNGRIWMQWQTNAWSVSNDTTLVTVPVQFTAGSNTVTAADTCYTIQFTPSTAATTVALTNLQIERYVEPIRITSAGNYSAEFTHLTAGTEFITMSWVAWNRSFENTIVVPNAEHVSRDVRQQADGSFLVTDVWRSWNATVPAVASVTPATEEQRQVFQRQREEAQRLYAEQEKKKKIADSKAEKLLRSCLSREQKESLDKRNCFYLYVGDKKYRIDRGYAGNVKLVDETDKVLVSYCIHPNVQTPPADAMLMQKLLLEADEAQFLRTANATRY